MNAGNLSLIWVNEAGSQPESDRLSTSSTVPGQSVPQRALFDAPPGRSLNSALLIERSAPTMASFPMQSRAGTRFPQFSTAVCPVSMRLWGGYAFKLLDVVVLA